MDKQTPQSAPAYLTIPVTIGHELLVEIIDLKLRIKSRLVGMEQGQYIIIKIFPNDLIGTFRSDAVKESPIVIRYLYRGTVYGFRAEVLSVVSAPAKLFFVTYPRGFDEVKALEDSRFDCILPATTMLANDIVEMTIIDISKDGCQCMIKITSPKNDALYGLIQVNKKISLMVQFPGIKGSFDLAGRVRNISKASDKILIGVLFEEMTESVKAELKNFMSLVAGAKKE